MPCLRTKWDLTQEVWSIGDTTTPAFVPYLRLPVNEALTFKVSFLLLGSTNLRCRRAVRYSDDGYTWDAATAFGFIYSASGWSWATTYQAVDDSRRFLELGLFGKNSTGTVMESGTARMIIDVRN